jgi:carbon storage regulator
MLALSRKKGEAIIFNNDIEVKILDIKGEQIKIGITAPSDVSIYRKEVYLQIQEANKAAADNIDAAARLGNLFK